MRLVYGDGRIARYRVSVIQRYQKVDSNSTSSPLIDLSTNQTLSAGEVIKRVYSGSDKVTFQTCIEKDGNPTWGLIFVIATPSSN